MTTPKDQATVTSVDSIVRRSCLKCSKIVTVTCGNDDNGYSVTFKSSSEAEDYARYVRSQGCKAYVF